MRASNLIASLVLAAASTALARPAAASEIYKEGVSDLLGMICVPECTICHTTNVGGIRTVTKPFGIAAQAQGLKGLTGGGSLELLATVLTNMRNANVNSDADPESDIEELMIGDDPNVVGGSVCGGPKYGCGATIAPKPARPSTDGTAAFATGLVVLAGALAFRRRRR